MIRTILAKPFAPIQKLIARRRRRKIYLAHLEADYARKCVQLEMAKLFPQTWA